MKKKSNLIFTILFSWSVMGLVGQDRFVSFDEDIGFCSHSYHIIQDDYGFLWSATLTGLVKTDGYRYTKFTYDSSDSTSIATNFSTYLFQDRFSNIWVNSHHYGLSIYNRSNDAFIRLKSNGLQGLRSSQITHIEEVNDSILYICGNAGLEKVILANESYEDLSFDLFSFDYEHRSQNRGSEHIWHAERIDSSRLFLSTVMGFAMYDIDGDKYIYQDEDGRIPDGVGFASAFDAFRNELWVAKAGSPLISIDLSTGNITEHTEYNCVGGEYYMMIHNDILWMKSNGFGLLKVNLNNKSLIYADPDEREGLIHTDRWAKRLITTKDESIFLASNADSRFQHLPSIPRKIESIKPIDSKNNSTSSIYRDQMYSIYSFYNNGILLQDHTTGIEYRITSQNSDIEDDLILSIKRLSSGNFLILGRPHAYILDPITRKIKIISSSFFYRNGIELSNGDLWLFSEAYPIDILKKRKRKYQKGRFDNELGGIINIRQAIENEDGSVWLISATEGLLLVNDKGEILQHHQEDRDDPTSIVSNSSECMYKTSDGNIWIGTLEGLSIFDLKKGQFSNYSVGDGFRDSGICDIIEDDIGRIWVATFDGLYWYDESRDYFESISGTETINNEYSQRGFFSFDGKLYAAGSEGIDIINISTKEKNLVPPTIQLTDIIKNEESLDRGRNLEILKALTFQSDERDLSLEFAAIHYGTAANKAYEYRVGNDEWIDFSKTRRILLSRIPYGSNTLAIRVSNADGIWSKPKEYLIDLKSPWTQSIWFYILLLVGFLAVVLAMYRWRISQLEKINKQQIEIDRQIAEIELKALKAQMNPHFVFNSLNSVKALILEQKTDEAVTYLSSFSKLIRKILNNSNDKFIRLQDEIETVRLYLELESLRFSDAFEYEIHIDSRIGTDFVEVPALLLQPYVENAIWHGLLHKQDGLKMLRIEIRKIDHKIEINIWDNGIGRSAAQKIKTRSTSKNESFGMAINNQRINLLKEHYGNDANINIIDMVDENGLAKGTRVVIQFIDQD